jgi:hypothetical protein
MARIALAMMVAAMIVVACGQETVLNIFLEDKTSTSFSFSGNARAIDFEILELPRTKPLSKTNPYSFNGETIWKISTTQGIKADKWPGITYGEIPIGFSQTIPDHGLPPRLSENKLYVGRIVVTKDSQSVLFFEIRNGKPINVSDEVLGP